MRPSARLRTATLLLTLLTLATSACSAMKGIMNFAQAVTAEYRAPVNVSERNGKHLVITFQETPPALQGASDSARAAFARDVATFAKAHYPDAAKLEDVTIGFASTTSVGPLTVTRSDAPYQFELRELK